MNKKRRKEISDIIDKLSDCHSALSSVAIDEEMSRSFIPENLETSAQYEKSEECSEAIEEAKDNIDDAIQLLQDII